ncbi:hypothetical protein pdam_00023860 [Pocillopora damicornis]|uniref:Uncharacterized protein n=1 Tax=Pocillopora damicornis TaxID=46731 RepID=A0A3M6TH95_POCDA|nr:hypothetical protein pdam_00023860 [Pocillopora damicornis]
MCTFSLTLFKKRRSQLHRGKLSANSRVNFVFAKTQVFRIRKDGTTIQKRPAQPKVCLNNAAKYQFVLFDTKTTSPVKDAEICQITAITKGGKIYNNYILPTRNISLYGSY